MQEPIILISALIDPDGVERTRDALDAHGFVLEAGLPVCAQVEIACGYFAYLRGSSGHREPPTLFQPPPVLDLFFHGLAWVSGSCRIYFGRWPGKPIRAFLDDPVWRGVLYLEGPASALKELLERLLAQQLLPKSTAGDLEEALLWWATPSCPRRRRSKGSWDELPGRHAQPA